MSTLYDGFILQNNLIFGFSEKNTIARGGKLVVCGYLLMKIGPSQTLMIL